MNPLAFGTAIFFLATGHFWLFIVTLILISAGAFDDD